MLPTSTYVDIESLPQTNQNTSVRENTWLGRIATHWKNPRTAESDGTLVPASRSNDDLNSVCCSGGGLGSTIFLIGMIMFLVTKSKCEGKVFDSWDTRECTIKNIGAIFMIVPGSGAALALVIGCCALGCFGLMLCCAEERQKEQRAKLFSTLP